MTIEEQLAALQAENAALKTKMEKAATLSLKVSEKGACSLYGVGRFPVTLYATQWARVLGYADTIKAFLETNKSKLATKEQA